MPEFVLVDGCGNLHILCFGDTITKEVELLGGCGGSHAGALVCSPVMLERRNGPEAAARGQCDGSEDVLFVCPRHQESQGNADVPLQRRGLVGVVWQGSSSSSYAKPRRLQIHGHTPVDPRKHLRRPRALDESNVMFRVASLHPLAEATRFRFGRRALALWACSVVDAKSGCPPRPRANG